ncbi:anticodon-binding protein [Hapalosiphon sp. MRB220]|nr:anticodon-binding protein [Hapalosiphon sp. MRB220]
MSDRTIAKKIRELSARKIPLIAVVGEKEAMNQSLNLRRLGIARQEEIPLAELEVEFCSLHTEAKFQLCQH